MTQPNSLYQKKTVRYELFFIVVLEPDLNLQWEDRYASVPWEYHLNSVYTELRDRLKGGCRVIRFSRIVIVERAVTLFYYEKMTLYSIVTKLNYRVKLFKKYDLNLIFRKNL